MGMDNNFYKIRKTEADKFDLDDLDFYISGLLLVDGLSEEERKNKYRECFLCSFRKYYELYDVIEKIHEEDETIDNYFCKINKDQLEKIISELEKDAKSKEWNLHKWDNIEKLEIIYRLFDFDNYYLLYNCVC